MQGRDRFHCLSCPVIGSTLAAGADGNLQDEDGWTALMIAAAYCDNPDVILVLLEADADGKLKSKDRMTAFDYARELTCTSSSTRRDSDDSTAAHRLHLAKYCHHDPRGHC